MFSWQRRRSGACASSPGSSSSASQSSSSWRHPLKFAVSPKYKYNYKSDRFGISSFCERRRILWYWRELLCGLSQYVSGTSDKGLVAGNIFRDTNVHCTFETPILDQKFWWGCIRVLTLLWCHDLHDRHLKRHPCWSIWGSVDVFTLKSTLLKFRYNNQTEQFAIITESNDTVKTYWRKIHLF